MDPSIFCKIGSSYVSQQGSCHFVLLNKTIDPVCKYICDVFSGESYLFDTDYKSRIPEAERAAERQEKRKKNLSIIKEDPAMSDKNLPVILLHYTLYSPITLLIKFIPFNSL